MSAEQQRDEWEVLVQRAYAVILGRIRSGTSSTGGAMSVLHEVNLVDRRRARELAADVVRLARAEAALPLSGVPDHREPARRQRAYAIARRLYDDVRLGEVGDVFEPAPATARRA